MYTLNYRLLLWAWFLTAALCIDVFPFTRAHAHPNADVTIYADDLAAGWEDWSWETTTDSAATTQVHSGARAFAVTYKAAWAGFSLRSASAIDAGGYTAIRFWANGGGAAHAVSLFIQTSDGGDPSAAKAITIAANGWSEHTVALSDLGSPGVIKRINLQDASGAVQATFYLDDIQLIGADEPPVGEITLAVDVAANRRPIPDDIYGINWGDENFAAALDIPVRRWGGNRTTRYNWQNDMSNTAIDWYFENVRESDAANPPADSAVNRFVAQDQRTGAASYLTVPLIGWVSNDDANACSFSTARYDYVPAPHPEGMAASAPDRPACGNGVIEFQNGNSWQPIFYTGNDKTDTSIPVNAAFAGAWVTHLTGKFGTAANGGVRFYGMDNEPELWNTTHADVHPTGYTYDELATQTLGYAAAIKAVDPTAKVLGPEYGGWWGFFTSAKDVAAGNNADREDHGNVEITAWYLQQLAAYEQQHGVRLLDYLSLHIYPQGNNIFLAPQLVDAATQQRRMRSVRALWDPTYIDESWIADTADGPAMQLIPRMRAWIDANYPGTKLAISEYNWGALGHINGALAQADILGIFGREGVDLAAMWDPPALTHPAAYAFRIYRDYDGHGARFGDVRVSATSSDQAWLAVYASQRSSDRAVTLVIVNKSGGSLTASVSVANFAVAGAAQVYRYSPANLNAIVREADQPLAGGAFTAVFPKDSITLAVMEAGEPVDEPAHKVFLPAVGGQGG